MDENLREMFDNLDFTLEALRQRVNKLDQLSYALYEEAEEDLQSDEIGPLLIETGKAAGAVGNQFTCITGIIHDIAKEILK